MEGEREKVQPGAGGGPMEHPPEAGGTRRVERPAADAGGVSAPPGGKPEAERERAMYLSQPSSGSATLPQSRRVLPATRESVTHKFTIGNHEGYLTIGLHGDGRPGEVFIKMSKEGSTISGLCQAFCRALSLALQHGLSVEDAVARFKGMRFEPMGATNNPAIPEASSIVDYVARFIEQNFVQAR